MDLTTVWKESTQKIFWGVIIIAVAGIFNVLYDYVSFLVTIFEFAAKNIPGDMGNGLVAFFGSIHALGFLAKAAVIGGYVLYLLGLTRFAAIQSNVSAAQNILKVRSAVIILICCFATGAIFGVLLSIPFVGTLISLAVWIATLIAYFKMKNAFSILMTSPAFSVVSQKGAKKLRLAALSNIILMLLPLALGLVIVLLGLIAVATLKGGTDPTGFLYVGGFVGIAFIIGTLVLMFFALVYPCIGWYQIMKGGPGEETLTDKVEQQLNAVPTSEEQVKAIKEKGEAALASAKDSFANAQKELAPKMENAKSWVMANKKGMGIGAVVVAVVALLAWLIPKIGSGKGITFETYEIMDNIQVTVDVPQGDGEREQNVLKGIRQIIAESEMCKEAIGTPIDGTIQDIIADCQKRYQKYADDYIRESGAPYPPTCQLFIESDYQNEACVTFKVDDGVYFNGAPESYFRVVRFSDGHVMTQQEMVHISADVLGTLLEKYNQGDLSAWLDDGFYFTPAANDSLRAVWPTTGHGWGEALIPLSEMEPYMTEDGKELFTAKPLEVPEKVKKAMPETGTSEEAETAEEAEADMDMDPGNPDEGLLGSLPEGTTKYVGEMAGFPIEFTIHKRDGGGNLQADYLNVKYSARMKLQGESLPADGGNISFFGNDTNNNQWNFYLEGDVDHITGTANGDGKELPVTLHRKE